MRQQLAQPPMAKNDLRRLRECQCVVFAGSDGDAAAAGQLFAVGAHGPRSAAKLLYISVITTGAPAPDRRTSAATFHAGVVRARASAAVVECAIFPPCADAVRCGCAPAPAVCSTIDGEVEIFVAPIRRRMRRVRLPVMRVAPKRWAIELPANVNVGTPIHSAKFAVVPLENGSVSRSRSTCACSSRYSAIARRGRNISRASSMPVDAEACAEFIFHLCIRQRADQQARRGQAPQHLRPQGQCRVAELVDAIEAAEGQRLAARQR